MVGVVVGRGLDEGERFEPIADYEEVGDAGFDHARALLIGQLILGDEAQGWEETGDGRTLATSRYQAEQEEDICAVVSQAAAFIREQDTPSLRLVPSDEE